MLTTEEGGATLSTVDVDGDETELLRVSGQAHQVGRHGDGVVVVGVACADETCEETVVTSSFVDHDGSAAPAHELDRRAGSPSSADSVRLIGSDDELVWISTDSEVVAYDPRTGEVAARADAPRGLPCAIGGALHVLLSSSGEPGVDGSGPPPVEPTYDVAIHQLADDAWLPVPESRRTLTESELVLAECAAGTVSTGPPDVPSPAWSPDGGWAQRPPLAEEPMPIAAGGQEHQRFVLNADGTITRIFATVEAPMSREVLELPAGALARDQEGPPPFVLFDQSAEVLVGCVQQSSERSTTASCHIRPI